MKIVFSFGPKLVILSIAITGIISMTTPSTFHNRNKKKSVQQQRHHHNNQKMRKPLILCLHGRCQSGAIMSNKIAGARKKFQRLYELEFLDGPLLVVETDQNPLADSAESPQQLAWWEKDSVTGSHVRVNEAFSYVMEATKGKDYDAILGFSQGGLLGASLVLTGAFPNVKAVLTAGSPYIPDVFECAKSLAADQETIESGLKIPKLHLAGLNDAMVPVESTRRLCDVAGNGRITTHEKGHLFPTKAAHVNVMMQFLEDALQGDQK
jgi:predicted esterase